MKLTKEWFLLEESYQNQEILEICTDAKFAIEQTMPNAKRIWDDAKIEKTIENCRRLLNDLIGAIENISTDLYLLNLSREIRKKMDLRPKQLSNLVKKLSEELSQKKLSRDTVELLNSIIDVTCDTALMKWNLRKPSF